jgi:3-isopropylmalate/(R)-2-methylmalate dehydratase small subunit
LSSNQIYRGRAWVFGDNIDTDVITPADTTSFGLGDEEEHQILKENAFRAVRERFYEQVRPGDILIAGKNFGLGSHREPANRALQMLGFSVVIAESVARLFFRNAVAIGQHTLQVPGITGLVREGDELEVDLALGRIRNVTTGAEASFAPYSPLVADVIDAGGIIEVLKRRLAAEEGRSRPARA